VEENSKRRAESVFCPYPEQEDIPRNIAFSRRGSILAIKQENCPVYFRTAPPPRH